MTNSKKGICLVIIATIFWGMMGISSRSLSMAGLNTFDISFFRCFVAGALYLLWILKKDISILKLDLKGILICSLYGIITFALGFISYNMSVERIPISIAIVLMFTNPIWVTLFGAVLFKEKITKKKVVVIILCIIGCLCIGDVFATGGLNLDMIGVVAGLINGITFALQIVIPKVFEDKYKKDSMLVYGFIGAAVFLAFFADFNNIFTVITTSSNAGNVVLNILSISVLSTFIANTFYVKSTNFISTSTTSILVALEPIVASIFAFIVFGETLNFIQIIGAVIIVVAAMALELDLEKCIHDIRVRLSKEVG